MSTSNNIGSWITAVLLLFFGALLLLMGGCFGFVGTFGRGPEMLVFFLIAALLLFVSFLAIRGAIRKIQEIRARDETANLNP